ncbi:MAG: hypothetical protein JWR26_4406 [Pedosphaera sp.]|nr:hypothetical protein [Pedosphaera sp.]
MKLTIFTLSSARSGTLYLRNLFKNNIKDCTCRHEPFFDWGNPTLFGRAIYDAYAGRLDRIREKLARKRDYINRLEGSVYLESSHAFLKSAYVAALESFPEMRLIHLIRDPLKVAKSEAYREEWRRRVHAPFHFYTGDDGRRHFAWSLTTNEEIFRTFDVAKLSLFQLYLIQWIEIEHRAIRFLEQHQLHDRCFTMHSPGDLNDATKVREMFDFLGLKTIDSNIITSGRKNKSIGRKTVITPEDERECEEVLERLPIRYLELFRAEPYANHEWSARFQTCATTMVK